MRAATPLNKLLVKNLEKDYLACIHAADEKLLAEFGRGVGREKKEGNRTNMVFGPLMYQRASWMPRNSPLIGIDQHSASFIISLMVR